MLTAHVTQELLWLRVGSTFQFGFYRGKVHGLLDNLQVVVQTNCTEAIQSVHVCGMDGFNHKKARDIHKQTQTRARLRTSNVVDGLQEIRRAPVSFDFAQDVGACELHLVRPGCVPPHLVLLGEIAHLDVALQYKAAHLISLALSLGLHRHFCVSVCKAKYPRVERFLKIKRERERDYL